jgi:serine/threonine protein kinase
VGDLGLNFTSCHLNHLNRLQLKPLHGRRMDVSFQRYILCDCAWGPGVWTKKETCWQLTNNSTAAEQCSTSIRLGRLLSRGGFAEVYQATVVRHKTLGSNQAAATSAEVAVKVYTSCVQGCSTERLLTFAHNEHVALAMLRNQPAVVQLLATAAVPPAAANIGSTGAAACATGCSSGNNAAAQGSTAGSSGNRGSYLQTCLVLEYLQHGPVTSSGFCSQALCKLLLRPVLHALHIMHSGRLGCRIIHRDVKPDNLLLRDPMQAVLADYGCCFIELAPMADTVAGMHTVVGSPYYMAPEVTTAAANGGHVDASIDCYALGVTLTQMLGCLQPKGPAVGRQAGFVEAWQQQLAAFFDGPGDAVASAALREFVGCCCGVGQQRAAAAQRGEPARLTPAQLLMTAWMTTT